MNQVHSHGIFRHQVLGEVLGAVGGTVLAASAAKTDLQMREPALKETLHMGIDQTIDMVQEAEDLSVLLQKLDDGRIQSGQLLEPLVLPGLCTDLQSNTYPPPFPDVSSGIPFLYEKL